MITSPHNEKLKDAARSAAAPRATGASSPRARTCSPPPTRRAGSRWSASPRRAAACRASRSSRRCSRRSRRSARARGRWPSTASGGRPRPPGRCCVALWGVRDPGNVGTVLRSALAFGADCVAIGPGTRGPVRAQGGARLDGRAVRRAGRPRRGASPSCRASAIALVARAGDAAGRHGRRTARWSSAPSARGCPATSWQRCDRTRAHPDRLGVAERGDGGDGGPLRTVPEPRMIDRIEQIAEQARHGRSSRPPPTAALEQVRVQYLGRKAELPNLLRGVAELPPEQRGAVGKAANVARAASRRRSTARGATLEAAELDARLAADRVDVTLPGDPPQPVGRLHLLTQTRREIEDVFVGLGFSVARGPRGRVGLLQLRRAQPRPGAPGAGAHRHVLRRGRRQRTPTRSSCARTPRRCRSARCRSTPPPIVRDHPRAASTAATATRRTRRSSTRSRASRSTTDITLADLKGTLLDFARAIFGADREVRLRPHFFPFTEPCVEVDVSCFNCAAGDARRLALPGVQGHRLARDPRRGDGRPERASATCASTATTPSEVQGFAFGMGIERIAMLKHGIPDLRTALRQRRPLPGAVRMRLPLSWLHEYCEPDHDAARHRDAPGDDRHRGRAASTATASTRSSTSSSARCSPPSSTRTPTACASARSTSATPSRRRSSAARRTSPPARPSPSRGPARSCPTARGSKKAKLRGVDVRGHDPRRGRARHRHATTPGSWCSTTTLAPGSPSPRCCRSPPTCSSSRSRRTGPTASASTASRARSMPRPARRWRPRRGRARTRARRRASTAWRSRSVDPDLCPRFTARAFEDVTIGPSPPWLKARLMAAGQRPINNVVDITNYVMLLTGQPLHAFDLDRIAGGRLVVRRAPDGERGRRRSTAQTAHARPPTWS